METEVKVAVLEQKLEDLNSVVLRIDTAIQKLQKLSEVNTTVSRMLAVHEERISKQEETDSVLFTKIDKLRDKMDGDHDLVLQRIRTLEKRVWMGLGGIAVISMGLRTLPEVSNYLTSQVNLPIVSMSYRK
jgi:uncharacterized coiled-coil protein SlyX